MCDMLLLNEVTSTACCKAYLICSIAEIGDGALNFFQGIRTVKVGPFANHIRNKNSHEAENSDSALSIS